MSIKGGFMCLNCGCAMPEDDMGDKRNITMTHEKIESASTANAMSYNQSIDTMVETLKTMKKAE